MSHGEKSGHFYTHFRRGVRFATLQIVYQQKTSFPETNFPDYLLIVSHFEKQTPCFFITWYTLGNTNNIHYIFKGI